MHDDLKEVINDRDDVMIKANRDHHKYFRKHKGCSSKYVHNNP